MARGSHERTAPLVPTASVAAVAVVIVLGSAAMLKGIADVRPEIARVVALENETVDQYEKAVGQFKNGGMSSQALAKVLRFKHAFNRLSERAEAGHLGALECGYYDQSHFCREFKFFTGQAPTRFFRERLSVEVATASLRFDLRAAERSTFAGRSDPIPTIPA